MTTPSASSVYEPALPQWPTAPEPVDATGTSYLVVAFGGADVDGWIGLAEQAGPTTVARFEMFDAGALRSALAGCRTGVRVMVAGPQYDVLLALATARQAGLLPSELRSWVTSTDDLPLYCAHCRATSRVVASPGDVAECPSCGRQLEIHEHSSAIRGSFLASDARARELTA